MLQNDGIGTWGPCGALVSVQMCVPAPVWSRMDPARFSSPTSLELSAIQVPVFIGIPWAMGQSHFGFLARNLLILEVL